MVKTLFIDNFDSFTYNLVDYVSDHSETEVLLNTTTLDEIYEVEPDAIVISPGPGHPKNPRDKFGPSSRIPQIVYPPTGHYLLFFIAS